MTAFDYSRMDPAKREHFVYRCYDSAGRLLYVGCSMNLDRRKQDHRASNGHLWFFKVARTRLAGPFNYETARRLEKEAVYAEAPLWNYHEPNRVKARTIKRRIDKRWFELYLADPEVDWKDAVEKSRRHTSRLVGRAGECGVTFTDEDIVRFRAIDKDDLNGAYEKALDALATRLAVAA